MTTAPSTNAQLRAISQVADVTLGKTPKRSEYRSDGTHRLLKYRDIQDNVLVLDQTKDGFVCDDPQVLRHLRTLEIGDVLVGASGHSSESIGRKVAIVKALPDGGPHYVAGELLRIRPFRGELDSRWVFHFLASEEGFRTLQDAVSGVHLTNGRARQMKIPLTSLDEQGVISDLLDETSAASTSAQFHLSAARRTIERFRRAVIAAACSGRLTSDWRDAHPAIAAPIISSDRDFESLTETPAAWTWCRLAEVADIRGGIQKGARLKPGQKTREVPYLRVANVQRGWFDLSEIKTILVLESKIADLMLKPGDILFNEGGDRDKLGRGWVWEGQIEGCIHQNHVFRARDERLTGMEPRFFSWYGNTIGANYFVDQGKQTVNLASLSMTKLRELPVPVPSIDEQGEIVRRVDQLLKLADQLEKRIAAAGRRVVGSSQAVLGKAFRGELVPSSFDTQV